MALIFFNATLQFSYQEVFLCPKLYGLPKIHKPNLPLRPIVASNKSPTSALSKWLVSLCKPLMSTQISYIKNSSELVKKTKRS